jgi:hypothetical protein
MALWYDDGRSDGQEISFLSWNMKVHYVFTRARHRNIKLISEKSKFKPERLLDVIHMKNIEILDSKRSMSAAQAIHNQWADQIILQAELTLITSDIFRLL